MKAIRDFLSSGAGAQELAEQQRAAAAGELARSTGLQVYDSSVALAEGKLLLALARDGNQRQLLVVAHPDRMDSFDGLSGHRQIVQAEAEDLELATLDAGPEAAEALRRVLTWTGPRLVGLTRSVGLGDRLGLATPGHVRAIRGSGCMPYFAQQSIREMTRTDRTPRQVMDDVTWGVFQAGWRDGFGSDADHLKSVSGVDICVTAWFTMFTIDPGDHVRTEADSMDASALVSAADALAWDNLETSRADYARVYAGKSFALDGGDILTLDDRTVMRAAVKYGAAIAHTVRLYRHLRDRRGSRPFELEVSVDETATPTTPAEHYLIAAELRRLGVAWVGLAPRFVGEFEKGIDYKGDLAAFERSFAQHLAIARTLGPYKLSIHSGSDKFAVYPVAARLAGELVHVKTAGTSYLEALRVVARCKPELFRRILDFAFTRFDEDRASYRISARAEAVPRPADLADDQLETILNGNDGRQLLHVTYGSVLTGKNDDGSYRFRSELMEVLIENEEEHYAVLAEHLGKHVRPFAR